MVLARFGRGGRSRRSAYDSLRRSESTFRPSWQWKWFWGGLAVAIGLFATVAGLRWWQLGRMSVAFREQGIRALAAGQSQTAQRWLEASLAFGPGDPETQAALAGALARSSRSPAEFNSARRSRAVQLYTLALDSRPQTHLWLRDRAELELAEHPEAALASAGQLLADLPSDRRALELRTRALAAMFRQQESPQTRVALYRATDDLLRAYPASGLGVAQRARLVLLARDRLASDLRREPSELVAEVWRALAHWISCEPQSGEARLARYAFRCELAAERAPSSRIARAEQELSSAAELLGDQPLDSDLECALNLAPDRAEVQLAVANHWVPEAFQRGWFEPVAERPVDLRLQRCQQHLLAAIAAQPHDDRAYLVLAELARLARDRAALPVVIRQATMRCKPPTPRLLLRRAEWQAESGRWVDLRATLAEARELSRTPAIRGWMRADPLAAEELALVSAVCHCRMLAVPENTPYGNWSSSVDELEALAGRLGHPDLAALAWHEVAEQCSVVGDQFRARRARDQAQAGQLNSR